MARDLSDIFHAGELEAQRRFNPAAAWSGRAVEALDRMFRQAIDEETAFFIERREFFFIATADTQGRCDCSFRGTEPGLDGQPQPAVRVIDPTTLVFPDYSGNRLYNSLGNLLINPRIGLLFMDFAHGDRLRVNGRAAIVEDQGDYGRIWSTAPRYVRIGVEQVFWNCARRIPRQP